MGGRVPVRPRPCELMQPNVDAERTQFGDECLVVDSAAGRVVPVPGHKAQLCVPATSPRRCRHLTPSVTVYPAQASGCSRKVTSSLLRPGPASDVATRSAISRATASVVVSVPARLRDARRGCGS